MTMDSWFPVFQSSGSHDKLGTGQCSQHPGAGERDLKVMVGEACF